MIFLPVQCRMARAALGMGIRELARAAKVSIDTVVRFESGQELRERTVEALQRALEVAGVEFTNGEKPGVRLTRPAQPKSLERDAGQQKTGLHRPKSLQEDAGQQEPDLFPKKPANPPDDA